MRLFSRAERQLRANAFIETIGCTNSRFSLFVAPTADARLCGGGGVRVCMRENNPVVAVGLLTERDLAVEPKSVVGSDGFAPQDPPFGPAKAAPKTGHSSQFFAGRCSAKNASLRSQKSRMSGIRSSAWPSP